MCRRREGLRPLRQVGRVMAARNAQARQEEPWRRGSPPLPHRPPRSVRTSRRASRTRSPPRWRAAWRRGGTAACRGTAAATWAAFEARGYPASLWGTYRQWAKLGGQVRKGERAATVVFWRFPDAAKGGDDVQRPRARPRAASRRRYGGGGSSRPPGRGPRRPRVSKSTPGGVRGREGFG